MHTALFMYVLVAVFGAAIGSFLNVCISRLPEGHSLAFPASHCPRCLHPIHYYDNIPIISYLILRGRCRHCRGKIPIRYLIVEMLAALLALLLFRKFGLSPAFVLSFLFTGALIVITFIDLDLQMIPDVITLPGIPFFSLASVFFMNLSFLDVSLGILLGGGVLYAVAFGYERLTGREGMGGGDIKLLAMLGAFLGVKSLIFILLVSSLVGALVGIVLILAKGKDMKYAVPFGPFLSLAAVAYIFFGDYLTWLFLSLYGR